MKTFWIWMAIIATLFFMFVYTLDANAHCGGPHGPKDPPKAIKPSFMDKINTMHDFHVMMIGSH